MAIKNIPPFSKIMIGEPDANSEYFSALKINGRPIFLDCFFAMPEFPVEEFISGQKYLIYGQKGTGKTSVLRRFEEVFKKNGATTEFLIFKKAFIEEIDLQDFAHIALMLDEDSIKKFKHYHHTLKRLLILILLNKLSDAAKGGDEAEPDELKGLISQISNSSVGDAIKFGLDSIGAIFKSVGVDIQKITSDQMLIEGGRLLKRSNDALLGNLIRKLKREKKGIRILLDEIHFAYRSEESLQQDAILVRDTILAIQSLNDRFAEEGVNAAIYAAIRSEYLEHPIISTADINHAIESVGHELTWTNFPSNDSHPLFDVMVLRFKQSIGGNFQKNDFFKIYLGNVTPSDFLERTWSKPRDLVRYFKCAKKLYPNSATLSSAQLNAVWRNYSQEAWRELKSAASPFLPPNALSLFEETLARVAPAIFDGSAKYTVETFSELLRPVYELAKHNHANFYDFTHFMRLLYILGIFLTKRRDALEQDIFHSYHRGNRNYHANGEVMVHPTVLKAFG